MKKDYTNYISFLEGYYIIANTDYYILFKNYKNKNIKNNNVLIGQYITLIEALQACINDISKNKKRY